MKGHRVLRSSIVPWAGIIALAALLVRSPLIFNTFEGAQNPDSVGYLAMADELLDGEGFSGNNFRPPGYPLFLTLLAPLPGSTTASAVVVQHLLGIALAAAVTVIGNRYFGRVPAVIAGALVALAPPMIMVEHLVLADFLLTIVVFAAVVALIEAVTPSIPVTRGLVLAGALLGMAILVKPIAQVLVLLPIAVLAVSTRSWRATLRGSAVVLGTALVLVVPWLVHNAIEEGEPVSATRGGQALWLRAFDEEKLPIPTDSADGRLAQRLYESYIAEPPPGFAPNPQGLAVSESYSAVFLELQERGLTESQADRLMGDVAFEAVRSHPRVFAEGTAENVRDYAEMNGGRPFTSAGVVAVRRELDRSKIGLGRLATGAWAVSEVLVRVLFVLSLALLAAFLLLLAPTRQRRLAAAAFVTSWLLVAIAGAVAAPVQARYAAAIAPETWLLEAAAAWLVVTALVAWVRDDRGGPGRSGHRKRKRAEARRAG